MVMYRERYGQMIKVAEAAKAPASAGWDVYTRENRTVVVRQVKRDSLLANPNAALMQGARELLQQTMSALPQTGTVTLRNEIWVHVPEWSYDPATPVEFTGAAVTDAPIAPGQAAASDTVRRDLAKFRQKIGYPYAVHAYRVVLGVPRTVFVTLFDSREKYFGTNAMGQVVERAKAQAEWQAMLPRLVGPLGMDWETNFWNYNKNMSYGTIGTR
jgi:hypothetical protein